MTHQRRTRTQPTFWQLIRRSLANALAGFALIATTALVLGVQPTTLSIVDVAPAPARTVAAPVWDAADAGRYPAFVDVTAKPSWIPARILVETHAGATQVLPYSEATIEAIDATWDNDDPADDLFTIGASQR